MHIFSLSLKNSQIENNFSYENGGAIYLKNFKNLYLKDTEINSNRAIGNGGGLYMSQDNEIKTIDIDIYGV